MTETTITPTRSVLRRLAAGTCAVAAATASFGLVAPHASAQISTVARPLGVVTVCGWTVETQP